MRRRAERKLEAERLGSILVRLHWQCWREDAPPIDVTELEFVSVMEHVIRSGSVGLVWPRMRTVFDPASAVALAMEASFQSQVDHNAKVERELAHVVTRLRADGIDPVLVKGLALARLYPEGLVRPAGDLDLVVRTEEFERTKSILAEPDLRSIDVDLKHPANWGECPRLDVLGSADHAHFGEIDVRVLRPPDEVLMLVRHWMIHGGSAAKWLCDIACTVERLNGDELERMIRKAAAINQNWLRTVLGTAENLLGMRFGDRETHELPTWLTGAVMAHWLNPSPPLTDSMGALRTHPWRAFGIAAERWPDPVMATAIAGTTVAKRYPVLNQIRGWWARLGILVRTRLL